MSDTPVRSVELKTGARLASAVCDAEVVVIKAPSEAALLECGGVPMGESPERVPFERSEDGGVLLGKRYTDERTGLVVLCTKGGDGSLTLDGRPLQLMATKPLPASD